MDPGRLQLDLETLAERLWDSTAEIAELAQDAARKEAAYRSTYASALLRATGTVSEREARATVEADEQRLDWRIAEAKLRAAEEVVRSLRSLADIARTIRADMRMAAG